MVELPKSDSSQRLRRKRLNTSRLRYHSKAEDGDWLSAQEALSAAATARKSEMGPVSCRLAILCI